MINLPLLQTSYYQTQTDWRTMAILGGITAVVVIALAIYSRATAVPSRGRDGKRFRRRAFHREAISIGLTKHQARILENFIRSYQVRRPFNLLSNSRDLNITLGKALRDVEHMKANEQVIEQRKQDIYRIKQHLDRVFAGTSKIVTTKQLRLGQNITFQQADESRFTSVITANLKGFYCAQVPIDFGNEQIKWNKGNKIKLFIWGVDGEEMVFESKVLGYTNVQGIKSVMLTHTKRINRTIMRQYRRRPIKGQCFLHPIRIIEKGTGRKTTRQAVVITNKKTSGIMINLSVGGCALFTHKPLPRGELTKLIFELERGKTIVAFGKIINSQMLHRNKTTLHIMFTRASSKNLNKINEYVYDFN